MAAADRRRRTRSPGPLLAVALLVVLGVIAAAVRPPWRFDPIILDLPHPTGRPRALPPPPSAQPSASARSHGLPGAGVDLSWLKWVLLGLLVAAALLALVLVMARLLAVRRMYAEQPEEDVEVLNTDVQPDLPTLQQGAARAEERLLAIGRPTDAIIAAWLALEEAAHGSGVDRRPAQTPSEFTTDVLGRTGVPAEPVQTLLGLYLRARFSAAGSGPTDLDQARRCIRALADSWSDFAGEPAAPGAGGRGADRDGSGAAGEPPR